MKPVRILILATLVASILLFQTPQVLAHPQPSQVSRQTTIQLATTQPATTESTPTSQATRPPADSDRLREDLQRLTDRVLQLQIDVAKSSQPSSRSDLTTAIIAGFASLITVMVAGGLTLLGQRFMVRNDERRALLTAQRAVELARQEALFQQTEKILEFRVKQLELFYAPMFALLEQSKALYDKMLNQIVQDEPLKYKPLATPDSEGYRVHVLAKDGTWKGFRLLDQLPAIRTSPHSWALIGHILSIGKLTTRIISKHAGLASEDVINLLGEYLAHYAILSTIYKSGETKPYEPGWHKMGYYPRQLNVKIEEGYRELSQFLDEYGKASKRMLETLPLSDSASVPIR